MAPLLWFRGMRTLLSKMADIFCLILPSLLLIALVACPIDIPLEIFSAIDAFCSGVRLAVPALTLAVIAGVFGRAFGLVSALLLSVPPLKIAQPAAAIVAPSANAPIMRFLKLRFLSSELYSLLAPRLELLVLREPCGPLGPDVLGATLGVTG